MKKMHSLAYNIAKAKLKGSPYKVNYAVTYQCNSRCIICDIWKKYLMSPQNRSRELTLPEIGAIFENFDLTWISLTGGEPFLRKDLADIVCTVKEANPHLQLLTIPTNGSLPDTVLTTVARILDETAIANVVVSVSLDGDQYLHDKLRGVPGLWEKARKTYQLLKTLKNDRFDLFVEFTVSKYNAGHLFDALNSFNIADNSRVVLTAAHSSYFYQTHHQNLHESTSADQVHQFCTLKSHFGPERMISFLYAKILEKRLKGEPISLQCVSGRSSFFLDPYGVLYPCITMEEPFGDLKEYSLPQLVHSERGHHITKLIQQGLCPGCWTPCEAYQTILEKFPLAWAAVLR